MICPTHKKRTKKLRLPFFLRLPMRAAQSPLNNFFGRNAFSNARAGLAQHDVPTASPCRYSAHAVATLQVLQFVLTLLVHAVPYHRWWVQLQTRLGDITCARRLWHLHRASFLIRDPKYVSLSLLIILLSLFSLNQSFAS